MRDTVFLWIAIAIIATILIIAVSLLFVGKFKITVAADSNMVILLKVSAAGIPLYTLKEKNSSSKIRLSDYTTDAIQKRNEQKSKKAKNAKTVSVNKKRSILDTVKLILQIIKTLYQKYMPHLEVELTKINISVGTDDAASTAILYGVAVQSISYAIEWMENNIRLSKKNSQSVNVTPNFCSAKTEFDVRIILRLPIRHALGLLMRIGMKTAIKQEI